MTFHTIHIESGKLTTPGVARRSKSNGYSERVSAEIYARLRSLRWWGTQGVVNSDGEVLIAFSNGCEIPVLDDREK